MTKKSKHIATPYGPKTSELLCRAMDALEMQNELVSALDSLVIIAGNQLDQSATAQGLINCNILAACRRLLDRVAA